MSSFFRNSLISTYSDIGASVAIKTVLTFCSLHFFANCSAALSKSGIEKIKSKLANPKLNTYNQIYKSASIIMTVGVAKNQSSFNHQKTRFWNLDWFLATNILWNDPTFTVSKYFFLNIENRKFRKTSREIANLIPLC